MTNQRLAIWAVVGILVVFPSILILVSPESYSNPLVSFLLSILLAGISVLASRQEMWSRVRSQAQTEWLSQAESACDRLLTTAAQVKRLSQSQNNSCGKAVKMLPELETEELRSVRMLISTECTSTSNQLSSIYQHMQSAILDWERFIRKNCESDDCKIIGDALTRRRVDLERDSARVISLNSSSCNQEKEEVHPNSPPPVPGAMQVSSSTPA